MRTQAIGLFHTVFYVQLYTWVERGTVIAYRSDTFPTTDCRTFPIKPWSRPLARKFLPSATKPNDNVKVEDCSAQLTDQNLLKVEIFRSVNKTVLCRVKTKQAKLYQRNFKVSWKLSKY